MSLLLRRKRTVSLTIEDDAIRMVRFKTVDPLVVEAVFEVPMPANTIVDGRIVDTEVLTDLLETAVKEWGIAKRNVSFLAPDSFVVIRKVSYPEEVQEDELKGHFFIEIGSTIYLPFEDPVFDVVPYTTELESNEAILIASKESVLTSYEAVLDAVKLHPVVADIAPLALYRLAYQQHHFSGQEHILLVDLYPRKMTVSIFYDHFPLFMRSIEVDLPYVLEGQAPTSLFNTPTAILAELEKLVNFYRYNLAKDGTEITHVLLNGELEDATEWFSLIRERLLLETLPVVKTPILTSSGEAIPASFNRVIGLALKEV